VAGLPSGRRWCGGAFREGLTAFLIPAPTRPPPASVRSEGRSARALRARVPSRLLPRPPRTMPSQVLSPSDSRGTERRADAGRGTGPGSRPRSRSGTARCAAIRGVCTGLGAFLPRLRRPSKGMYVLPGQACTHLTYMPRQWLFYAALEILYKK